MTKGQPSRRQEKVSRVIKESVSDTIANHLHDPRITGLISVTSVDVSPDMKNADVFLSIMAASDNARSSTFTAIEHATRRIQALLGKKLTSKFCPHLHFHEDVKLKKTLETLNLIEKVSKELKDKDNEAPEHTGMEEDY